MFCTLLSRWFGRRQRGSAAFSSAPAQASALLAQESRAQDLESLFFLNLMAQQGSYSVLITNFPASLDAKILVESYSACSGFLGYNESDSGSGLLNVVIEFATASDAAMALANSPTVTVGDSTFTPTNEVVDSVLQPEDNRSRKKMKTTGDAPDDKQPTCKVCFEKLSGPYSKPCLSCKAAWCFDCVQRIFEVALSEQESFPARCCQTIIHYDAAKDILSTSNYNKYKSRYEEFSTPKPIYCASPTCSAFLAPRLCKADTNDQLCCYVCAKRTCSKCRNLVVNLDNHQCPTIDVTSVMLAKYGYKICPRCHGGVAHMYGCPHVRCSCGAHWCWDCQRPIQICWRNPCERSREDGNHSEEEFGNEDDESDSNTEVADTPGHPVQADTHPLPATESAAQQEVPTAVPQTEAATEETSQAVAISEAINTTEDPPAAIANDIVTATPAAPAQDLPAANTVPSEDALINLDGSDFEDWEGGDFDFGDEPHDESWDTWGCLHRFQDLTAHKLHRLWLPNNATQVDCLSCFQPICFKSMSKQSRTKESLDDAVLRGRTRTITQESDGAANAESNDRSNSASSTLVVSCSAEATTPETNLDTSISTSMPRDKPKVARCNKCGVIVCRRCKKAAARAIHAQLKKKTTVTDA